MPAMRNTTNACAALANVQRNPLPTPPLAEDEDAAATVPNPFSLPMRNLPHRRRCGGGCCSARSANSSRGGSCCFLVLDDSGDDDDDDDRLDAAAAPAAVE